MDYCKRCGGPEPTLCVTCVIEKDALDRASAGAPVGANQRLELEIERLRQEVGVAYRNIKAVEGENRRLKLINDNLTIACKEQVKKERELHDNYRLAAERDIARLKDEAKDGYKSAKYAQGAVDDLLKKNALLEAAVEGERERCAKLAENYELWAKGYYEICEAVPHLAKKIRGEG